MLIKCLPRETADIDPEYELLGHCVDDLAVLPILDLSFAVKGMQGSKYDPEEESQCTAYFSYEVPLEGDSLPVLEPGSIYRKDGTDYVEIGFECPMGFLMMNVYFLVRTEDCSFSVKIDNREFVSIDYKSMWTSGMISEAKR